MSSSPMDPIPPPPTHLIFALLSLLFLFLVCYGGRRHRATPPPPPPTLEQLRYLRQKAFDKTYSALESNAGGGGAVPTSSGEEEPRRGGSTLDSFTGGLEEGQVRGKEEGRWRTNSGSLRGRLEGKEEETWRAHLDSSLGRREGREVKEKGHGRGGTALDSSRGKPEEVKGGGGRADQSPTGKMEQARAQRDTLRQDASPPRDSSGKVGPDGDDVLEPPTREKVPARKWSSLKTVKELFEFVPNSIAAQYVNIRSKTIRSDNHALMLVHDMNGNYAEDAFMDGWIGTSKTTAWAWGFRPTHWAYVDSFVYFSHDLVSIPPRGWIDAAHKHGTKVLGTFLTEWEAGSMTCDVLFANEQCATLTAEKLEVVRLAFGFDGWLINIENKLDPNVQVSNLKVFLKSLSKSCPMVVWYDSVLPATGELKWQNGLNSDNAELYECVNGGILTNYGWNETKVQVSNTTANELFTLNKIPQQVWHGIDVFGRGTPSGGGMHCDTALNQLEAASVDSTHACLFAPGWTLEQAAAKVPNLGRKCNLEFWDNIVNNTSWGKSTSTVVLDISKQALYTDFCDGGGSGLYIKGERAYANPWLDLRRQTLQPKWDSFICVDDAAASQNRIAVRCVDVGAVYSGNCAISLTGKKMVVEDSSFWIDHAILNIDARLGGPRGPSSMLRIGTTVLPIHGDVGLCLELSPATSLSKNNASVVVKTTKLLLLSPTQLHAALAATGAGYVVVQSIAEKYGKGGWLSRKWELRVQEYRGRKISNVSLTPLPVRATNPSGSPNLALYDVRVGFVSLDETGVDCSKCFPADVIVAKGSRNSIEWKCACGSDGSCSMQFVNVFVNGVFKTTAFSNECSIPSFSIVGKDHIVLRGARWDGSICGDVVVV